MLKHSAPAPKRGRFLRSCAILGALALGAAGWPAVNSDVHQGRETIGAMPHVPNAASLSAASTVDYPQGVWRDEHGPGIPASPLFFKPGTMGCAAAGFANDAGSCVDSADGKSWVAVYPEGAVDLDQFGATADADSTTQMQAALTALAVRGGGTLTGSRTYRIDSQVFGYSDVRIDIPGTIDGSRWTTAFAALITYAGTAEAAVNLGAPATTGATTLTTAAATQWGVGDWFLLLSQRCALYPEAGAWRLGHPSSAGGSSPLFGEVMQVQSISGVTITPTTTVYYPEYNTTGDAGVPSDICPNRRSTSTVERITWVRGVNIHIGRMILGGDDGVGTGGNGVQLTWALNPVVRLDHVELGRTTGHALEIYNTYGADIEWRAARPADFTMTGAASGHAQYNSMRVFNSWNANITQHDINGSQGTDVTYVGGASTNYNINIRGDAANSKESGATFHAGTMTGSIGPMNCVGMRKQCVTIRSRRINLRDITSQRLRGTTNECISAYDAAIEFTANRISCYDYPYGLRITRAQDSGDPDSPVRRNIIVDGVYCDYAQACVYLGGDPTYDYPTSEEAGVIVRNVACTRCDHPVHIHSYWNGTDIDGISVDTTGSPGNLSLAGVYAAANAVKLKIGTVSGRVPPAANLVWLSSISDTTTFPTAQYPWGYHDLQSNRWSVSGGGNLLNIANETVISANYTAQIGDNLRPRQCTSPTPVVVTIPPASSVPFARGQSISIIQTGSGSCSFAAGAGVTIRAQAGAKAAGLYATITATLLGTNTWYITGQAAP